MTPLEVAAGYTVFANGGVRAEPMFIDRVVDSQGSRDRTRRCSHPCRRSIPRVAYQVTNVLEDVINHGTGASVRARGFHGPRRRQDRHLARRLVRRIHVQPALHRLGRL